MKLTMKRCISTNFKFSNFLFILLSGLFVSCGNLQKKDRYKQDSNTPSENAISREKIDSVFEVASNNYLYLSSKLEEGEFPKTFYLKENKFETTVSNAWISGFYPATLLNLYESTGKDTLRKLAENMLGHLKKEAFNTSTHDLGFIMYSSFGKANRIEPKSEYQDILMQSAKSLSTRYNDTVKAIRSWNSAPWNKAGDDDFAVIIDNMMNLELLLWATKYSGDSTYYKIAVNHAKTTIENHFRKDYSTYHEVIYKEATGKVKTKITVQGYADESSWARGQAWGLYGFTMIYRETNQKKFLEQAKAIADFIINNPNLPDDKIPYWDFNAGNIPDALRDSSSAAIMASALIELSWLTQNQHYFKTAEKILNTLISNEYLANETELAGFILKHGIGNMPGNTEVDVPLTYGDYYLIEALKKYQNYNNSLKVDLFSKT